jgi:hypothetical protein
MAFFVALCALAISFCAVAYCRAVRKDIADMAALIDQPKPAKTPDPYRTFGDVA